MVNNQFLIIQINKNISSSGSFIGVLNLTIESAPTKPKDNANEDFTTAIITVIIKVNNTKFDEIFSLSAIEFQKLI